MMRPILHYGNPIEMVLVITILEIEKTRDIIVVPPHFMLTFTVVYLVYMYQTKSRLRRMLKRLLRHRVSLYKMRFLSLERVNL